MSILARLIMVVALTVTQQPTVLSGQAALDPPLRIMVLGDSISVGCGTAPLAGWCGVLSSLLDQRGIPHTISAYAIAGQSCRSLQPGFVAAFDNIQPNLVILACGTNDAPNSPATADAMGWAWRTMVEYSYTHGAYILPSFVQYSNLEINTRNGRGWLLPGEGAANDVIYSNMQYYTAAGWFAGLSDLQRVPGDWNYLNGGSDGIHPNPYGQSVYAAIYYRALREFYSWPDTVAEPCGMWGHRIPYSAPTYMPCLSMTS